VAVAAVALSEPVSTLPVILGDTTEAEAEEALVLAVTEEAPVLAVTLVPSTLNVEAVAVAVFASVVALSVDEITEVPATQLSYWVWQVYADSDPVVELAPEVEVAPLSALNQATLQAVHWAEQASASELDPEELDEVEVEVTSGAVTATDPVDESTAGSEMDVDTRRSDVTEGTAEARDTPVAEDPEALGEANVEFDEEELPEEEPSEGATGSGPGKVYEASDLME
jgi:hypothetical protein